MAERVHPSTSCRPLEAHAPAPAGEARTDARELIAVRLIDGEWHEAGPIIADCKEAGVYKRAAQRAADDLGVEKEKHGFPATSHWRLRGQEVTHGTSVTGVTSVTSVVDIGRESRGDRDDTDDRGAECRHSVISGGVAP
jgi:hypothetical protein